MLRNPKQLKFISPLHIPEGKSGTCEIEHKLHPANESIIAVSMRDFVFTGQEPLKIRYRSPVSFTFLKDINGIWMADVPAEQMQAYNALKKCKGRVLVGGLGLGYFAKKLQEKNNVTSVVVIEISQDVINLVWKHLRLDQRFTIIHADIKKYLKAYTSNRKFDWAYLDVWRADSEWQFVDTVLPLKRLVHKYACDKVSHILSWQEDVMLGQLEYGLMTRIQVSFDELVSMSTKKFNHVYKPNDKYLASRRIFWKFIRENNINAKNAAVIVPAYVLWVRNGMQESVWEN